MPKNFVIQSQCSEGFYQQRDHDTQMPEYRQSRTNLLFTRDLCVCYFVCVCMCVYVFVCTCTCVCACVCVCLCMHFVCVCLHMCHNVHLWFFVCLFVFCLWVCLYVCMAACMCDAMQCWSRTYGCPDRH